ncbi:hypothetical protein A3E49_01415 [Candidatus Saccharibacteria bacterium RIFCSPHIGHO2_12_FULL_49_19]|nr:MAG: hypothetical protein A3E49_01415 [Candidatus Saccharibacteria bacterium RIFCSPHIGHO2_12_FULL_49_19]OGL37997.1 MAG: hypothetical protein A3B63_01770 [Candidatus Saccharibacteria bacterium RIFCSPLOWO2_01_FULL_49_22]
MDPEEDDFYKKRGTGTAVAEPPTNPLPSSAPPSKPPSGSSSVTWTASEYLHHDKGFIWYVLLLLATVVLAAAVYFLTKDYFATGAIVAVGIIIGIYAVRKPGQITYELSGDGLRAGQKMHPLDQFKSFSVIRSEGPSYISLLPLKKFMPPVDAYFSAQDEEKITDVLGQHLPYDEKQASGVDRLSRKLRL